MFQSNRTNFTRPIQTPILGHSLFILLLVYIVLCRLALVPTDFCLPHSSFLVTAETPLEEEYFFFILTGLIYGSGLFLQGSLPEPSPMAIPPITLSPLQRIGGSAYLVGLTVPYVLRVMMLVLFGIPEPVACGGCWSRDDSPEPNWEWPVVKRHTHLERPVIHPHAYPEPEAELPVVEGHPQPAPTYFDPYQYDETGGVPWIREHKGARAPHRGFLYAMGNAEDLSPVAVQRLWATQIAIDRYLKGFLSGYRGSAIALCQPGSSHFEQISKGHIHQLYETINSATQAFEFRLFQMQGQYEWLETLRQSRMPGRFLTPLYQQLYRRLACDLNYIQYVRAPFSQFSQFYPHYMGSPFNSRMVCETPLTAQGKILLLTIRNHLTHQAQVVLRHHIGLMSKNCQAGFPLDVLVTLQARVGPDPMYAIGQFLYAPGSATQEVHWTSMRMHNQYWLNAVYPHLWVQNYPPLELTPTDLANLKDCQNRDSYEDCTGWSYHTLRRLYRHHEGFLLYRGHFPRDFQVPAPTVDYRFTTPGSDETKPTTGLYFFAKRFIFEPLRADRQDRPYREYVQHCTEHQRIVDSCHGPQHSFEFAAGDDLSPIPGSIFYPHFLSQNLPTLRISDFIWIPEPQRFGVGPSGRGEFIFRDDGNAGNTSPTSLSVAPSQSDTMSELNIHERILLLNRRQWGDPRRPV